MEEKKRPVSWFGRPPRTGKTRVVPRAIPPNHNCHHKLRKQFYKEEIALSERLHHMGYTRRHIMDVLGMKKSPMVTVRLQKPWMLTWKDMLGLSVLLKEDFLDVVYEIACEIKNNDFLRKKQQREARLKKVLTTFPTSASTEYKGKSLRD